MVHSREELEMVVRVARERNLLVLSDDIYDRFVYDSGHGAYLGQLYENIRPAKWRSRPLITIRAT